MCRIVYLICDGLCNGVPVRRRFVPVRFANQQNHAGRHTDEEAEGRAEAEGSHLEHGVVFDRHYQVRASLSTKPPQIEQLRLLSLFTCR